MKIFATKTNCKKTAPAFLAGLFCLMIKNKHNTLKLFAFAFVFLMANAGNATTYYLTAAGAGNAQTPASWNTNPAGGGTAASNFTTDNDIFRIPSTISGTWTASSTLGTTGGNGVSFIIDGTLTISNGVTITLSGKKNQHSASITVNGTIIFSASSNISLSIDDAANFFTLASGATLKTANTSGILGTGCSITKTSGANLVTLTNGANYEFNGSTPQATLGLPTTGTGTINTLTINNAAGVSLSAAVTVTTLNIGGSVANSVLNDNGKQITSTGTLNLTSGTFNIGSGATATTYPAFGTSNISTGTTVNYNSTSPQIIAAVNYYNLSSVNGARTLPTGTVGIAGTFLPGSGNYTVTTGNAVSFNGTTAQIIPLINPVATFAFYNLIINNAAGISSIANDITVNNSLALTQGIVTTGAAKKIIISSGGFVSRPPTTGGWVYGNLQKTVSSTIAFDFEIGDATYYCPINIQYTSLTTSGSLLATVTSSPVNHPAVASSGLDATKTVTRYWTLTSSGGLAGTYNAAFTFNSGAIPGGADYTNFSVREYNSGAWVTPLPTTINRTSTSTKATGLTAYGDFIVGESTGIPTVAVNPVSSIAVCEGGSASFTSSSASTPTTTIQWQVSSDNGGSWNDITNVTDGGRYSGFTTGTLTISNAIVSMSGYRYRAKFTNINGTVTSSNTGGKLIVNALPVITSITYTQSSYSTASPAQSGPTFGSGSTNYTGGLFSVSPSGLANFNTSTGAFTPIGSTVGTYTVTYQVTNGACAQVSASTTVSISDASISYSQSAFCNSNGSTQSLSYNGFTASPSATITVSSVPAGANLNNNSVGDFKPSLADPAVYTVTYTDGSVVLSTNVTVTQLPSVTISYSPSSICSSDGSANPVIYTGAIGAYTGGTFAYTPSVTGNVLSIVKSGGSASNPLGSITGTGSDADNYNITYKIPASGGCPAVTTSSTLVTVVASPTATLTYGTGGYAICKSMTSVSPVVTGLPGGGSYSQPSGQTGLAVNSSGDIDPSSSSPGTYNMIYTVNSGTSCGDVSVTSADIVIVDDPSLSIGYAATNFCTGDASVRSVIFTGTGSHAGATFSAVPSGLSIDPNTGGITPASSTGNPGNPYLVTATIPNCPLATPITTSVEIDPSPSAGISYDAPSFCELDGNQHAVTITGTTGGSFTYTSSPSGLSLNIDQPTGGSITPSGSSTGSYTVKYTVSNGACSTTATTSVAITPQVGPTTLSLASGSSQPTCQITSSTPTTTYNATATNNTGFIWSINPSTAGSISSGGVVTWTVGFSGTVTISVQAQGCGGSTTSDTRFFTINPTVGTPTAITLDPSSTEPTCQLTSAGTTSIYGTTATDNTGLNWSLSTVSAGSINSSGVMTWANGFSGSVDIRVTASGCNGPSTQVIRTVNITPTVGTPTAITISAGTEPTCQLTNGTTTTTYTTTATNNTGFNWSLNNAAAGSIDASTGVMTWANGFSGSVNIQVTANGCNGPSTQVIRTVNITPTVGTPTAITISAGTQPTCQLTNGTTTTTYATTATNGTGFNWSLSNAAAGSINASTGVMTWANGFSGSVNIQVTASGCNGPSSQVIRTVNVSPTSVGGSLSPASSSPLTVCTGANTGAITLSGNIGTVMQWETSTDGGSTWTNIGNAGNTTLNYLNLTQTTLYRVLIQSGPCGGTYSSFGEIVVLPAFTPTITPSATSVCVGSSIQLTASGYTSTGLVIDNGDFNAGPKPGGWLGSDNAGNNNGGAANAWGQTNGATYNGFPYSSSDGSKFLIVSGAMNSSLQTPVFSTVGLSSAVLVFNEGYNLNAGTTLRIDISFDGGTTYPTTLRTITGPAGPYFTNGLSPTTGIDLNTYLGLSNLRIRFRYTGTAGSDWALDNVFISNSITNPTGINVYNPLYYTWSPLTYLSSPNTNTTTPTVTMTPTAATPTSVTYTVSASVGTCTATTSAIPVTITINPVSAITNITATPICSGTAFSVTPVNGTNGTVPAGTTYTWSTPVSSPVGAITGGSAQAAAQSSISQTLTNTTTTPAILTYIVTPHSGTCTGATFTVTVTVNPSTVITAQPVNATYCQNAVVTPLSVTAAGTAPITYQWYSNTTNSNSGGTIIASATSSAYTPSATIVGTFYYYVTVTGACGVPITSTVAVITVGANSWTGAAGTDWNNTGNWCSGAIPTATTDVIIPVVTNLPVLSVDGFVHNLTIASGANVALSGHTLEIDGTFTGSATGYLKGSAASGVIIGGNATTLYFDQTTDNSTNALKTFTINSGGNATLGNALNIASGTFTSPGTLTANTGSVLNTGGLLTLKSDLNGDARVAESYGTISGNVTVERYFPKIRAWRFVTAPVGGSQTINQAWQEGVANPDIFTQLNPYPGFGTEITYDNLPSHGYDVNVTTNPSIRYWNPVINNYDPLLAGTNTTTLNAYPGYYLFVRGSRDIDLSLGVSAGTDPTVLRAKGVLAENSAYPNYQSGNAVKVSSDRTTATSQYFMVGNPYASPINLTHVIDGSRTDGYLHNEFYVWDPKIAGDFNVGGYVTYSNGVWAPSGESYPGGNGNLPIIQSGQAFLMKLDPSHTTVSLEFHQADKYSSETQVFGFGKQQQNQPIVFYTNLLTLSGGLLDGVAGAFTSDNAADAAKKNASKKWNSTPSIGLYRNNAWNAIEFRPMPVLTDTLFYYLNAVGTQSFTLQITTQNVAANFPQAWLVDKYLNTKTMVIPGTPLLYNFTPTSDINTYRNRFMLVFKRILPVTPIPVTKVVNQKDPGTTGNANSMAGTAASVSVHPNPVSIGGKIMLQFNNMNIGKYEVTLTNTLGQALTEKTLMHDGGSNTYSLQTDGRWAAGNYFVKITGEDGYNLVTKLVINK